MQRNLITIQEVRANLSVWGRFWFGRERLQGYASRNVCDKIGESFATIHSDIYVPEFVAYYGALIEKLNSESRRAIRAKYVCKQEFRENWQLVGFESKKEFLFWLKRAELSLMHMDCGIPS